MELPKESTIDSYFKASIGLGVAGVFALPHPMAFLALAAALCLVFYAGWISRDGVNYDE